MRLRLDENPTDEVAPELRAALTSEPTRYAHCQREHLGGGFCPDGAMRSRVAQMAPPALSRVVPARLPGVLRTFLSRDGISILELEISRFT